MDLMTTASGRRALELGSRLGRLGTLAVGAQGTGLGWMLARCAGCGASLSGGEVLFHDGTTPAAGAWLAKRFELPAALFLLEREGCCALCLTDAEGRQLSEEELPPPSDWAGVSGSWDKLAATDSAYAAHMAEGARAQGLAVTVMEGPGQRPLRLALERLGCEVLSRPRPGVPLLRSDELGFSLLVRDGTRTLFPEGHDAVSAAVSWCVGRAAAQRLAVPAFGGEDGDGRQV